MIAITVVTIIMSCAALYALWLAWKKQQSVHVHFPTKLEEDLQKARLLVYQREMRKQLRKRDKAGRFVKGRA